MLESCRETEEAAQILEEQRTLKWLRIDCSATRRATRDDIRRAEEVFLQPPLPSTLPLGAPRFEPAGEIAPRRAHGAREPPRAAEQHVQQERDADRVAAPGAAGDEDVPGPAVENDVQFWEEAAGIWRPSERGVLRFYRAPPGSALDGVVFWWWSGDECKPGDVLTSDPKYYDDVGPLTIECLFAMYIKKSGTSQSVFAWPKYNGYEFDRCAQPINISNVHQGCGMVSGYVPRAWRGVVKELMLRHPALRYLVLRARNVVPDRVGMQCVYRPPGAACLSEAEEAWLREGAACSKAAKATVLQRIAEENRVHRVVEHLREGHRAMRELRRQDRFRRWMRDEARDSENARNRRLQLELHLADAEEMYGELSSETEASSLVDDTRTPPPTSGDADRPSSGRNRRGRPRARSEDSDVEAPGAGAPSPPPRSSSSDSDAGRGRGKHRGTRGRRGSTSTADSRSLSERSRRSRSTSSDSRGGGVPAHGSSPVREDRTSPHRTDRSSSRSRESEDRSDVHSAPRASASSGQTDGRHRQSVEPGQMREVSQRPGEPESTRAPDEGMAASPVPQRSVWADVLKSWRPRCTDSPFPHPSPATCMMVDQLCGLAGPFDAAGAGAAAVAQESPTHPPAPADHLLNERAVVEFFTGAADPFAIAGSPTRTERTQASRQIISPGKSMRLVREHYYPEDWEEDRESGEMSGASDVVPSAVGPARGSHKAAVAPGEDGRSAPVEEAGSGAPKEAKATAHGASSPVPESAVPKRLRRRSASDSPRRSAPQ